MTNPSSSKLLQTVCWLLLVIFTLLTPQSAEAKRTIRAGIYDYKPLVYSDSNGTPRGIFVEILDQVAKEEQWDVQYLPGTCRRDWIASKATGSTCCSVSAIARNAPDI